MGFSLKTFKYVPLFSAWCNNAEKGSKKSLLQLGSGTAGSEESVKLDYEEDDVKIFDLNRLIIKVNNFGVGGEEDIEVKFTLDLDDIPLRETEGSGEGENAIPPEPIEIELREFQFLRPAEENSSGSYSDEYKVDKRIALVSQEINPNEANIQLGGGVTPFKLTVSTINGSTYWSVSSTYSSITDGTNGDNIDLSTAGFDNNNIFSSDKYIVLGAAVDTDLVATSWTIQAVDIADSKEIGITGTAQSSVRLLIGKTSSNGASQAVFTAQELTYKFLNGSGGVKGFVSAPVHADVL